MYFICISEAAIVGRGCSTKDKVFYRECETHSYGENLEKMCFCSFDNCNPADGVLLKYAAKVSNWYNLCCLLLIIASGYAMSNYQQYSTINSTFQTITGSSGNCSICHIWRNPWPSDATEYPNSGTTVKTLNCCTKCRRMYFKQISKMTLHHCPNIMFKNFKYIDNKTHLIQSVQNPSFAVCSPSNCEIKSSSQKQTKSRSKSIKSSKLEVNSLPVIKGDFFAYLQWPSRV